MIMFFKLIYFGNPEIAFNMKVILNIPPSTSQTVLSISRLEDLEELNRLLQKSMDIVQITFRSFGMRDIILQLYRSQIISKKINIFWSDSSKKDELKGKSWCYFNGKVVGSEDSMVVASLCHGVEAIVKGHQSSFRLVPVVSESQVNHIIEYQQATGSFKNNTCKTNTSYNSVFPNKIKRQLALPRSNISGIRYLEIYLVLDHSFYQKHHSSLSIALQKAVEIINYSAALFRKVNMFMTLLNVEVWDSADQIPYENNTLSSGPLLNEFIRYASRTFSSTSKHDIAILLTNRTFMDNVGGRARINSVCAYGESSLVISTKHDVEVSSITLTHEIGHALGLFHLDQDSRGRACRCKYQTQPRRKECIMSAKLCECFQLKL